MQRSAKMYMLPTLAKQWSLWTASEMGTFMAGIDGCVRDSEGGRPGNAPLKSVWRGPTVGSAAPGDGESMILQYAYETSDMKEVTYLRVVLRKGRRHA